MTQKTEGPATLPAPKEHVRTDRNAPKAKAVKAVKETPKAEKKPAPQAKPAVFTVHVGRVIEEDGQRRYHIDKTETDTLESAIKAVGVAAAKYAGKDLRELIIGFPKIRKVA